MNTIDLVLFIIEIFGCISFASSGAITAIRKRADILGIYVLTLIEVFGGGLLRDLIINDCSPHIFWDREYHILALVCIVVITFWFIIAYLDKTAMIIEQHRHDLWIYFLDAIGIATFTISGCMTAFPFIPSEAHLIGKYIYVVSLGVISGVGGGMFRDIFIGEIPSVFRKHFYMTPCILGAILFSLIKFIFDMELLGIILSFLLIVILRFLAIIFKWDLPTAKGYNKLQELKKKNE